MNVFTIPSTYLYTLYIYIYYKFCIYIYTNLYIYCVITFCEKLVLSAGENRLQSDLMWRVGTEYATRTLGVLRKLWQVLRTCGWKKPCTTWDGRKPINNGMFTTYQLVISSIHSIKCIKCQRSQDLFALLLLTFFKWRLDKNKIWETVAKRWGRFVTFHSCRHHQRRRKVLFLYLISTEHLESCLHVETMGSSVNIEIHQNESFNN